MHTRQQRPTGSAGTQPRNQWLDTGLGKLPPQDLDLERAILGALLLESQTLGMVNTILTGRTFYAEAHQRIYAAITSLDAASKPIDLLTVTQSLRANGEIEIVGGMTYLIELTTRIETAANIETHAHILAELALKREMIALAATILRDAYEDTTDAFSLLSDAEKRILTLSGIIQPMVEVPFGKQLQEAFDHGVALASGKKLPGIPSIYKDNNDKIGGYQPGKLYLIGARPSIGKSLYAINEAIGIAYRGAKVGFWMLEMVALENNERIISLATGLQHDAIKYGHAYKNPVSNLIIQQKITELSALGFHQYDMPSLNLRTLRTKARKMRASGDLDAMFIDYLQLMEFDADTSQRQNKSDNIGDISKGLKNLAKELGIPIIALVQLSRAVETRGGSHKPMLSDLRDSGNLEQDADVVQFLNRPEYYNITQDENGVSTKGLMEVITEKNRGGRLGMHRLSFRPAISSVLEEQQTMSPVSQNTQLTPLKDLAPKNFFESDREQQPDTPF